MLKPDEMTTGGFSAVPGNLGSFMQNIQAHEAPSEEFVPADMPEDELLPGGEAPIDFGAEDDADGGGGKVVPKNVGKGLARFVDKGMAFCAGIYTHDKSERFRATDQEMEELEEAFGDFLTDSGIDIKPAINLIIALFAIYMFKFNDLRLIRKENLIREREEELEAQRREIEAYNAARKKEHKSEEK